MQVLESTKRASSGANTAVAPELRKGVRMLMHHTRDTDQKQWNETRVLAMQVYHAVRCCVGGWVGGRRENIASLVPLQTFCRGGVFYIQYLVRTTLRCAVRAFSRLGICRSLPRLVCAAA